MQKLYSTASCIHICSIINSFMGDKNVYVNQCTWWWNWEMFILSYSSLWSINISIFSTTSNVVVMRLLETCRTTRGLFQYEVFRGILSPSWELVPILAREMILYRKQDTDPMCTLNAHNGEHRLHITDKTAQNMLTVFGVCCFQVLF